MKRFIIFIVCAFLLSGCTSSIKPDKLTSIKNISVISLLGDEFCVSYLGSTVFNKKRKSVNVSNWRIDEFTEEVVIKAILADGRYNYIKIDKNRDSLMKIYTKEKTACTHKKKNDINLIKDEIKEVERRTGIDTIILVLDHWTLTDYITGRSGMLSGYGIHQLSFLGIEDIIIHLFAEIIVIDSHNFEILAKIATPPSVEKIDKTYWDPEFYNLATDKKLFIEQSLKNLLTSKITESLKKLKLI
jgi:hypothetical protein